MPDQFNGPFFNNDNGSEFPNFFYDSRQGGFEEDEMIDPDQILLTESDVSFDSTVRDGAMYV